MTIEAICLFVLLERGGHLHVPTTRRKKFKGDGAPQKYSDGLQPPIHGKLEAGETLKKAFEREVREEGGDAFWAIVEAQAPDALTPANGVQPYVVCLTEEQWATYVCGPDSDPGPILTGEDLGRLKPIDRKAHKDGVPDDSNCYLFDDHVAVLTQLLS